MGVDMNDNSIAAQLNTKRSRILLDFASGKITMEELHEKIQALDDDED